MKKIILIALCSLAVSAAHESLAAQLAATTQTSDVALIPAQTANQDPIVQLLAESSKVRKDLLEQAKRCKVLREAVTERLKNCSGLSSSADAAAIYISYGKELGEYPLWSDVYTEIACQLPKLSKKPKGLNRRLSRLQLIIEGCKNDGN